MTFLPINNYAWSQPPAPAGNSTTEDLIEFYQQLPNGDRQFVILPHTAYSPGYSNNRHSLWYATRNFLNSPAPVSAS